jgi:hypothetical protein
MSLEALQRLSGKLQTQPQDPIDPTPIETLAKADRGVDAIVSQRELEFAYNDTEQDNFLYGGVLYDNIPDPSDIPDPGFVPLTNKEVNKRAVQVATFGLDYSSRLIRSALAVTGISATSERFRDIRKESSFWVAWMDLLHSANAMVVTGMPTELSSKISEKQTEQVGQIPELLTKPSVPTETLPGVGAVPTAFGAPEELEWVYDVVGELLIEAKVSGAVKQIGKRGMSLLAKTAYETGETIPKKGVGHLFANITDEQLSAIAESRRMQKVGLLGTRPKQKKIDESVRRTFDYIKETGEARLTKKQAIKAQRKKGAARIYNAQGEGYGRGYSQRLRKAGTTEKAESVFKPFLETTPNATDDYVTLQKTIDNYDFGGSKIYTTANAQEALAKLYEFGELLTKGDVEHLRDIFGNDFANSLSKFVKKPTGILGKALVAGDTAIKTMNSTARTLMTTGELSFLLRQGNYRAWSRPQDAIRSFMVSARSLSSAKYAQYWDEAMRASASGKRAADAGLWLGKWDTPKLLEKEEFFTAEWLDKVPGIGKMKQGFERGYVAGLNQLRLDWFDEGMDIIERAGKAGDTDLTAKWADYVNNMTGRADLDKLIKMDMGPQADKIMEGMVETSKRVLFAPRFAASKWNKHKVALDLLAGSEAPVTLKRMMVSDTVTKWRRYERLAHYASQNGYEVETDPRSSDYLKFRRGNTRFDVLGGDSQLTVLLARLASGQTKDTETGEIKQKIGTQIAQNYLSGKLNPAMSLMFDKFIAQETFKGEDLNDPKVLAKEIASNFVPLYIQDISDKIYNGYENEGLTLAESLEGSVGTVTMGFLGSGIQTYEPSARKKIEIIYNDAAQKEYAKDFADLTFAKKQDVVFAAEIDSGDELDELKAEAGMKPLSPGASARIQKARNKSERQVREGVGDDYYLFKESDVNVGSIGRNVGEVKLSDRQHKFLQDAYVKSIKDQLETYPEISKMPSNSPTRRMWLQDIVDFAREDAKDLLFFEEPYETK